MVGTSLTGIALAGLGLGMAHALDADHVMAVSGMSSRRPGLRTALSYAGRWGAGHGLTVLGIGSAVLLMGMGIPEALSHYAERMVGVVLVAIALAVLWDVWRGGLRARSHAVGGGPHGQGSDGSGQSARPGAGALFVGIMHGMAGSAPLLAMVPLMELESPWLGLTYLLVFGLGVVGAMLAIGGLLGAALQNLGHGKGRALTAVRLVVAVLALGVGGMFVLGA